MNTLVHIMKRLAQILAALLLLLLLTFPLLLSQAAKLANQTLLDAVRQVPSVTASLVSEHQNYFTSDATWRLSWDHTELATKPLETAFELQLQHGPAIMEPHFHWAWAHFRLVAAPNRQSGWQQVMSQESAGPLYTLEGDVTLLGSIQISDQLAAFKWQHRDTNLQLSSAQGNGLINPFQRELSYATSFSHVGFENANWRLAASNATVNKQLQWKTSGLSLHNQVSFDRLSEDKTANLLITQGKLQFTLEPEAAIQAQTLALNFTAEELNTGSWLLQNPATQIALNQVPNAFIEQLFALSQSATPAEQYPQAIVNLCKAQLPPKQPQLSLTFASDADGAKLVELKAVASLPEPKALDWPQLQSSPTSLIPQLNLTSSLSAEKTLVQRLATELGSKNITASNNRAMAEQLVKSQTLMMTNVFLGQGLINEEAGRYTTQVTLDKGLLTLNNKPFALPF